MNNRLKLIAPLCLPAFLFATLPALAATVVVGSCVTSKASYRSISDAVQGAPAGSTIQVCPGVYAEQVVIGKSLTLKGVASGNGANPLIVPPAGGLLNNAYALAGSRFWVQGTPIAAQVVIQGGSVVSLINLAFDATGANIAACDPVVIGVLIQNASATLNEVALKNPHNPCSAGGSGVGVLTQNDASSATTTTVKNSTFVNAGQAFEASGAANTSTLAHNSFVASPDSNFNAISISDGYSTVQDNSISNFNYPPAGTDINSAAYGIFLACVPGASVINNDIASTQVGIYALNGCTTTAVSITGNTVSNAPIIAIDAGGTNGLIQNNDIRTSQTAIRFPAGSSGNTIQNNTINDACAAYGSNPAAGTNSILNDTVANAINLTLVNSTGLCP